MAMLDACLVHCDENARQRVSGLAKPNAIQKKPGACRLKGIKEMSASPDRQSGVLAWASRTDGRHQDPY